MFLQVTRDTCDPNGSHHGEGLIQPLSGSVATMSERERDRVSGPPAQDIRGRLTSRQSCVWSGRRKSGLHSVYCILINVNLLTE